MSTEFQIFISSTVDDLKGIRKKLAKSLEQPGRIVRCSEQKKTNDLCRLIAKHRAALEKGKVSVSDRDLDKALEKKLKNELVGYHHAPALQRFVDAVRKGHKDNWKLDWNGRAQEAIEYVNQNLAVQAASAERRRQEAREELQAGGQTLADLSKVGDRVRLLLAGIRMKQIDRVRAVQAVLDVVESLRSGLFSFAEGERYTLVVHEARRRKLTSGRVDHFTKLDASATLAFDTVVSFVNMVLLQE